MMGWTFEGAEADARDRKMWGLFVRLAADLLFCC